MEKSFVPLLMGFDVMYPFMATRTIESKNSRMITMLSTPLCPSARLPVYVLFAGIFSKTCSRWLCWDYMPWVC